MSGKCKSSDCIIFGSEAPIIESGMMARPQRALLYYSQRQRTNIRAEPPKPCSVQVNGIQAKVTLN